MNISEWKRDCEAFAETSLAGVEFNDGTAYISLVGKYSVMSICCEIEDYDEKKYIEFKIDEKLSKAEIFRVLKWYDKDGNIILCDFLDKPLIKPMKDSVKVQVTFSYFGGEEEIEVKPLAATEGAVIPERSAVVASGSIDYGPPEKHPLRKCEDNLNQSLELIDKACAGTKPDIFVLTETFINRNISSEAYMDTFDNINGERVQRLKEKAKEHGIYLAFSIREIDDVGICYNSCIVLGRDGEVVANYHKSHLTRGEVMMGLKRGDEAMVIDTDFGKCGIAICWDLFFPEFVRTLVKKGAEIIINPTAGYHQDMHTVRAKDNGVYIVTAGACRENAVVINPDGKIIAEGSKDGIAKAEINLNERFPVFPAYSERRSVYLNEMRNELYIY